MVFILSAIGLVFANDNVGTSSCFTTEDSELQDGGIKIIGYSCKETSLKIPETIDWKTVVEIGENAFRNKLLTSVSIPSTVQAIDNLAFANNALTRVEIPEGVTTIWNSAFKKNQLTALQIPTTLKSIWFDAFRANKLKKITVPGRINTIEDWAFCDNAELVVEGVSDSLEWDFSKACFSLKRASLLEDSYAFENEEDENEDENEDEIIVVKAEPVEDEDTEVEIVFDEWIIEENEEDNNFEEDDSGFWEETQWIELVPLDKWVMYWDLSDMWVSFWWMWLDTISWMLGGVSILMSIIFYFIAVYFSLLPISMWEIYRKAGKRGWAFLVPVYWTMVYSEIWGLNKWLWAIPWLMLIIPLLSFIDAGITSISTAIIWVVSLIWWIIASYRIAKRYQRNTLCSVLFVIFYWIGIIILWIGKYEYITYKVEEKKEPQKQEPIKPVVATEQLNNVVEHFVWADEETPSVPENTAEVWNDTQTTTDISSLEGTPEVNESWEWDNISETPEVSEVPVDIPNVEDANTWPYEFESPVNDSNPIVNDIPVQDNADSNPQEVIEPQVVENNTEEEKPMLDEPISDLDQLMAHNQ